MPPLTSEVFAEKVLANKASAAATAARASFEKVCSACEKTYFSENAYQNHLGSYKHKAQLVRMQTKNNISDDAETGSMMSSTFSLGEPLETASAQSTADDTATEPDVTSVASRLRDTAIEEEGASTPRAKGEPAQEVESETIQVALNQCLFCNAVTDDLDSNLAHMSNKHGMHIPEKEYVVDMEGLIGYLYEKIHEICECLYCGQVKHTASGIQTHMRDRGHCMIPYQTEEDMLEIGEFYDFRSTYSDDEDEDEDEEEVAQGGVKLGVARSAKTTVQNADGDEEMVDEDEEGWESDASSISSVPTDEITSVPIDHSHRYKTLDNHRHHSHADPRPHRNTDGFHSHAHNTPHAVYHDEYELHLPTGRTAGHRSLNKYYRQNLRNYPTPQERSRQNMIEGRHDSDEEEEAPRQRGHDRGRQVMSRANGGLGMVGVDDARKRAVKAVEKKDVKRAQRDQAKYQWGINRAANSQKHFRVSLRFSTLSFTSANHSVGSSPPVDVFVDRAVSMDRHLWSVSKSGHGGLHEHPFLTIIFRRA